METNTIIPKLFKKAHARNSRGGATTFVTGNIGKYEFHNEPQYEGHEPSSHLMADNNSNKAWASIYKDDNGNWSNQTESQAEERNEVYTFHGKKANERMIDFARKGIWKK